MVSFKEALGAHSSAVKTAVCAIEFFCCSCNEPTTSSIKHMISMVSCPARVYILSTDQSSN